MTSSYRQEMVEENILSSLQKTRRFWNLQEDVTWELDRSGSNASWCRSVGL